MIEVKKIKSLRSTFHHERELSPFLTVELPIEQQRELPVMGALSIFLRIYLPKFYELIINI